MKQQIEKAKKMKNIFMNATIFSVLGMLGTMFSAAIIDATALIVVPIVLMATSCVTFAIGSHYEQKERKLIREYDNIILKPDPEVTRYVIERTRETTKTALAKHTAEDAYDSLKYTPQEVARYKELMDNEASSKNIQQSQIASGYNKSKVTKVYIKNRYNNENNFEK